MKIKGKEKRFNPGELVLIRSDGGNQSSKSWSPHRGQQQWSPAVIISCREMSVHVMDRPKRIVDTFEYRVFSEGKKKILYEEEIYKLSNDAVNN